MAKLLYVTFVDFSDSRFGGVIKKINSQVKTFEAAGYPVTLVSRFGSGVSVSRGDERSVIESDIGVFSRRVLTTAAFAEATKGGYGFCYMRSQFFCGNVKRMLTRLKNLGLKNVVEIPTYPYDKELRMQGLKGYPKLFCDRFYRTRCRNLIDRITTFNKYDEIFGVPAIILTNGVRVDDLPISRSEYSSDRLDVLSMSSMLPWHGLDRAIAGLGQYYEQGGRRDIHLHICGKGTELASYEALVRKLGLETRVTFYGPTYGEELDKVFDKCSVGLCALGVHRRGELYGSPLKTVEYLARGITVISEMILDFLPQGHRFLFTVPADESPLDYFAISEWMDSLARDGADRLHEEVRSYAYEHCDTAVTMKKVLDYFRSC